MQRSPREARWYRSLLYVPGQKLDWMLKAPEYGADALVLDLEDSVPIDQKTKARELVANVLGRLKDAPCGRFVRVNGWHTKYLLQDVEAMVVDGLDGVMLAKTDEPADVAALDRILTSLEMSRNLPPGRIEIVPLCESAFGMYRLFDICMASPRVKRAGLILGIPFGDTSRALGLKLSPDGRDSLYFAAPAAIAVRATGVTHILGGLATGIGNLSIVKRIAETYRAIGATGALAIHPDHIAILNEVYAPSDGEIKEALETLQVMSKAIGEGSAAIRFKGHMIDYANVRSSLDLLNVAKSFGIDVGPIPKIDI